MTAAVPHAASAAEGAPAGRGLAAPGDDLDDAALLRYSRQIVLRDVGGAGQLRLRRAAVAVVGAGGLGAPALLYLAGAGVGRITVIDDDAVALDNLPRQVLYTTADVGLPKGDAAAARLAALDPAVAVRAVATRLCAANADALLAGHDVIVEGSDSIATKLDVNDAAMRLRIPLVVGAVVGLEGQVVTALPGDACYRCLVGEAPDPRAVPTCRATGVLGPVAGMVGALQATEALRLLLGAGARQGGRVLVLDAARPQLRAVPLPADPACPCHAAGPG